MLSIVLIAFVSLILLLIIHEFSHFIAAKKFKAGVDEFGIGYPPRLLGKKIGPTIYSLNLLPFGAFVRIPEKKMRELSIFKRAVIILAGVMSFWAICIVLFIIVFWLGSPFRISDQESGNLLNPRVLIVAVDPGSPAETAGLKVGDNIIGLALGDDNLLIDKVSQIQDFIQEHEGDKIVLTIKRGKQTLEIDLAPRVTPPEGQGPMGVGLARVATKKYSFLAAIGESVVTTFKLTGQIIAGLLKIVQNVVLKKPTGAELIGPVGVLDVFVNAGILGPVYFLQTVALVALHAAVVNALPIPVADGGQLMFLVLEKIRKRPLNEKIEKNINAVFFGLLVALMIWVTIKDINRVF
jgi:regulator of sigma E protease